MPNIHCGAVLLASLMAVSAARGDDKGRVSVLETPDGGIQPQAAIGEDGAIHLVFFKGEPYGGDLYYATLVPGANQFSKSIRVNSEPRTAVAVGTIRGGQIALGQGGRVHAAWNGSVAGHGKSHAHEGASMFYTRSNVDRTAFEPQRDLMHTTSGLDGGGTVAADSAGNVYVAWHGRAAGAPEGEQGRRLWIARSRDGGATFAPEEPAIALETGACGCCGTRALADHRGALYILYRAATRGMERDMYLVAADRPGRPFHATSLQPWTINTCPMSSASLAEAGSGVLAAWETQGQVQFARLEPGGGSAPATISPPGRAGNRKHPAVAGNARGETILVWADGTGWQRGGALAWQVFDREGKPTAEKGRVERGVPVWGLATVIARPDGRFVIIH